MDKPICIFLSSTWQDLQPEREAVEKALHRMRSTSFVGMEYFGSRSATPEAISLTDVDRSDAYMGIFAHRYGSGITEKAYRRAQARGLPCLIYIKDDSVPVLPSHMERDPAGITRLEALKRQLTAHHTVLFFKSPDQLATQVVADLHHFLGNAPTIREAEAPPHASQTITIANSQGFVIGDGATLTQHFGTPATSQSRQGNDARLQHLVDNICQDLALLKEYEDRLRYEDDPRRKAKYRREIEAFRHSASRYRGEYDALRQTTATKSSQELAEFAARLQEIESRLNHLENA